MKLYRYLLIVPLFAASISFAEEDLLERWFQIELLIFRNPVAEVDNPENWPSFADIQHPESFIRLEGVTEIFTKNSETDFDEENIDEELTNTPADVTELEAPTSEKGPAAFVALSEFERRMVSQRETLDNSSQYEVLFHEAWNQPVPSRELVIPIRIDGGERFGRQSELQGYINLYVERYLHLAADLHLIEYEKSADPFSVVEEQASSGFNNTLNIYGGLSLLNADSLTNTQVSRKSNQFFVSVADAQMIESRRMRSKEVHYLDNPKFGMLVLITPITIQQP